MENNLAFENEVVISSPLYSQCGDFLTTVARKDYKQDFFNPEILCLDMDEYENQIASRERRSKHHTVDAVIGIKVYKRNKFSRPLFLFIELRMDYQSPNNLSKRELESKIEHTHVLVSTKTPIYKDKFFIFNDGVIQQMVNWFKNKSQEGGIIRDCIPLSVSEFNDCVKSEKEYKYVPKTDIEGMCNSVGRWLHPWNSDKFFSDIEYWLEKAKSLSYDGREYSCIIAGLWKEWNRFLSSGLELTEEEEIRAEIIEEDYFK